jgi:hypothetical protein
MSCESDYVGRLLVGHSANLEHTIAIRFAFAQLFKQWPKLRKNGNRETSARLVPKRNESASIKINVRAHELTSVSGRKPARRKKRRKNRALPRKRPLSASIQCYCRNALH